MSLFNRRQQGAQLPLLFDINSIYSVHNENGRYMVDVCIDIFEIEKVHRLSYYFDFQTKDWVLKNQGTVYYYGNKISNKIEEKLLQRLSPLHNPALSSILEREKKEIEYFLDLEYRPFEKVYLNSGRIFFAFQNHNELFCYDADTNRFSVKDRYTTNDFSCIFHHIHLVDRLKNHPHVRLKLLF